MRKQKLEMRIKNFKKITSLKKNQKRQKVLTGLIKIILKRFQLLLTETNLITKIKQMNLSILTLNTWLIILEIIQLVKQMLKKIKCIKQNKKCGNNKM